MRHIGHVSQGFPSAPWQERNPRLAAAQLRPPSFQCLPLVGPLHEWVSSFLIQTGYTTGTRGPRWGLTVTP